MKITLQGYLCKEPIFVVPETMITCQECRKDTIIKGDEEIEMEYNNTLDMEAVEEMLEITMEKRGWRDMVCPSCMEFRRKNSR